MLPNVPKKLKYYPNIPWANPEILKKTEILKKSWADQEMFQKHIF